MRLPFKGVHTQPERDWASCYAIWWMARLGRRRRSCQAAICPGKAQGAFEPGIAEWDLLPWVNPRRSHKALTSLREREPGELKHLSTRRKRKQKRCPQ